jgi:hypothetical protein
MKRNKTTKPWLKQAMLCLSLSSSMSLTAQNCPLPQEPLPFIGSCTSVVEDEVLLVKGKKLRSVRKEFTFNSNGLVTHVKRSLGNGQMRNTRILFSSNGIPTGWVNYSDEDVTTVSVSTKGKKSVVELYQVNIDGSYKDQTLLKYDAMCRVVEEQVIQGTSLILGRKFEYNEQGQKTRMELMEPDDLGRLQKSIMNFYVYLGNGLLWKHYYTSDQLVKHEYRYTGFDAQGNWTVREDFLASKQNKLGKKVAVITRSFRYQ